MRDSEKLLVLNINNSVTWRDLKQWANSVGNVRFADIKYDRNDRRYGLIVFEDDRDVEFALTSLHKTLLCGTAVRAQRAERELYCREIRNSRSEVSRAEGRRELKYPATTRIENIPSTQQSSRMASPDASSALTASQISNVTVSPQSQTNLIGDLGITNCMLRMEQSTVITNGEEYTFLGCHESHKLSTRFKFVPDCILVRKSTADIIELFRHQAAQNMLTFLVIGTPGTGNTVNMFVWLYMALHRQLLPSFDTIIVHWASYLVLITANKVTGHWEETMKDPSYLNTHWIPGLAALYLYEATEDRRPFNLVCCSVVFTSPNMKYFKEYVKCIESKRTIYYTPTWTWNEINALYEHQPTELNSLVPREDVAKLYSLWGGLPRQIFNSYEIGYTALLHAIKGCNAAVCIQSLEIGSCLRYRTEAEEVRTRLMQLEVEDDGTYKHAIANFGSPFIRDHLVWQTGQQFGEIYRSFMNIHGGSEDQYTYRYAAKIRGNMYEKLVLDKLRNLSNGNMTILSFVMRQNQPNTPIRVTTILQGQESAVNVSSLQDINHLNRVASNDDENWVQATVTLTHSLLVSDVHDCFQRSAGKNPQIVFSLPPDIFQHWHEKNTVQPFVVPAGTKATIQTYLEELPQTVWCIPGDLVEQQEVQSMMESLNREATTI